MSPQPATLKLSNSMKQILVHLRMEGDELTSNLWTYRALVSLAEIGYIKVGRKTTLTYNGRVVADHLIANSR
jgi:hypothetical protein